MSSSFAYSGVGPLLSANFRVIAPDMRGFGHSSYNKPITTHEELADDLKLLVDELKITKFSLLGWSTGGMVAFYFAVKYPELLEKLILFSSVGPQGCAFYKVDANGQNTQERITTKEDLKVHPFMKKIDDAIAGGDRNMLRFFCDMSLFKVNKPDEKIYNIILDEIVLQRHSAEICAANMLVNVTEENNGVSKGDGSVKRLKTPTLVIHGEQDMLVPIADSKKWKSLLGDLVSEKVFSDGSHNPLDNHLEDVVEELKSFLLVSGSQSL